MLIAGLAWVVSGSAVHAVAVLVVATPCPLLLAAPVAIVSEARARGLSLSLPREVVEEPGRGVTAMVDGQRVEVGKRTQSPAEAGWARAVLSRATWMARRSPG